MIALLEQARCQRRDLGYITEATRLALDKLGINGIQLEIFLHYNGVA